ncbi:MAG: hypothetical protein ABSC00_00980 [Acidimicrobiales bacterium]|jgi:hypothetical protein
MSASPGAVRDAVEVVRPAKLGLALPRAAALTDALLAPSAYVVRASELQELRASLLRELPPLLEGLPPNERLQMGAYELLVARYHPERCAIRRDGFVPSPARCRRAIGVAAVERCVRGRASTPQTAVAEVLESGVEDLSGAAKARGGQPPPWWAEWYSGLALGGRATVQAEAVTWATQLWTALDWRRFERPPVIGGHDDWWDCPGRRQLVVRGRAEVRAWAGNRQVMLVVASGFPGAGWRPELAHRALVVALARGEGPIPARAVGLWPASGLVRICEVDATALSEAATALVSAVGTWVDARAGSRHDGVVER